MLRRCSELYRMNMSSCCICAACLAVAQASSYRPQTSRESCGHKVLTKLEQQPAVLHSSHMLREADL